MDIFNTHRDHSNWITRRCSRFKHTQVSSTKLRSHEFTLIACSRSHELEDCSSNRRSTQNIKEKTTPMQWKPCSCVYLRLSKAWSKKREKRKLTLSFTYTVHEHMLSLTYSFCASMRLSNLSASRVAPSCFSRSCLLSFTRLSSAFLRSSMSWCIRCAGRCA